MSHALVQAHNSAPTSLDLGSHVTAPLMEGRRDDEGKEKNFYYLFYIWTDSKRVACDVPSFI